MRAALTAMMLTIATQAWAECGNLCDWGWWETATEADVQAELDAGADARARDDYGNTPLNWAAQLSTPATIQALLAAGADLMARNKDGRTPLHRAAKSDTPANIQALLDAGADVMARKKDGRTPLHSAVECFSWESFCDVGRIQVLLHAGADAKAKNKEGKTPWDLVQKNERLKGTKGYWALNDAQYN